MSSPFITLTLEDLYCVHGVVEIANTKGRRATVPVKSLLPRPFGTIHGKIEALLRIPGSFIFLLFYNQSVSDDTCRRMQAATPQARLAISIKVVRSKSHASVTPPRRLVLKPSIIPSRDRPLP